MNRISLSQRAAIAAAMLILGFTVTLPIIAAEDPVLSKPSPTEAQERGIASPMVGGMITAPLLSMLGRRPRSLEVPLTPARTERC